MLVVQLQLAHRRKVGQLLCAGHCAVHCGGHRAIYIASIGGKLQLINKKQADYLLFKEIIMLSIQGEHLKEVGLKSIIINIRV